MNGTGSIHASANQEDEIHKNSDPYMYMEDSDVKDPGSMNDETTIVEEETYEPEMIAEPEVEPEPIEEAVMEQEESSQSIMDLIHANRENSDSDTPDLFNDQNVHQLDEETHNSIEADEELETDQDLLEIPSFLRRQSK